MPFLEHPDLGRKPGIYNVSSECAKSQREPNSPANCQGSRPSLFLLQNKLWGLSWRCTCKVGTWRIALAASMRSHNKIQIDQKSNVRVGPKRGKKYILMVQKGETTILKVSSQSTFWWCVEVICCLLVKNWALKNVFGSCSGRVGRQ